MGDGRQNPHGGPRLSTPDPEGKKKNGLYYSEQIYGGVLKIRETE